MQENFLLQEGIKSNFIGNPIHEAEYFKNYFNKFPIRGKNSMVNRYCETPHAKGQLQWKAVRGSDTEDIRDLDGYVVGFTKDEGYNTYRLLIMTENKGWFLTRALTPEADQDLLDVCCYARDLQHAGTEYLATIDGHGFSERKTRDILNFRIDNGKICPADALDVKLKRFRENKKVSQAKIIKKLNVPQKIDEIFADMSVWPVQKLQDTVGLIGEKIDIKHSLQTIPFRPYIPSPGYSVKELSADDIDLGEKWSLKVDPEDIVQYVSGLKKCLRDWDCVSEAMQILEGELFKKMREEKIIPPRWEPKTCLLGKTGVYYPSMGSADTVSRVEDANRIMESVLLDNLEKMGINTEGFMPYFYGYVDPLRANNFVGQGHIMGEAVQSGRFLQHGELMHPLHWYCIDKWNKEGKLPLPKNLSYNEMLEIFMLPAKLRNASIWDMAIDNFTDSYAMGAKEKKNAFSGVNPVELQSGILCLEDPRFPIVQACLGNAYMKQVGRMCDRYVRLLEEVYPEKLKFLAETLGATQDELKEDPRLHLGDHIMLLWESLGPHTRKLGEISSTCPWNIGTMFGMPNHAFHERFEKDAPKEYAFHKKEANNYRNEFIPLGCVDDENICRRDVEHLPKNSKTTSIHYPNPTLSDSVNQGSEDYIQDTIYNSPDVSIGESKKRKRGNESDDIVGR